MAGSNIQTNWKGIKEARAAILKRAEALRKEAFIQMPGGNKEAQMAPGGDPAAMGGMPPGGDPAAMGGMPVDPAMMGGDPAAMGGMPPGGDPAAMGGMPMDPAAMAAMGGLPPGLDPAMAGMLGGAPAPSPDAAAGAVAAGAAGAGTPEPTITITLSQLWDVVTKVLGLAKKIGANGQGVAAEAPAPAQAPAQAAPDQDAIKSAVMEALGAMGAMR